MRYLLLLYLNPNGFTIHTINSPGPQALRRRPHHPPYYISSCQLPVSNLLILHNHVRQFVYIYSYSCSDTHDVQKNHNGCYGYNFFIQNLLLVLFHRRALNSTGRFCLFNCLKEFCTCHKEGFCILCFGPILVVSSVKVMLAS